MGSFLDQIKKASQSQADSNNAPNEAPPNNEQKTQPDSQPSVPVETRRSSNFFPSIGCLIVGIIALLILGAIIFGIIAGYSWLENRSYNTAFDEGHACFDRKDWAGAARAYKKALKENESPEARYNMASSYYNAGDYEAAKQESTVLIDKKPHDDILAKAFDLRANSYCCLGKDNSALQDINEAIRLVPGKGEYYTTRGWVYFAMKDWDSAIQDFTQAIRFDSKDKIAHHNRIAAYLNSGDRASAKRCAEIMSQEGLSLDPDLAAKIR